MPNRKSQARTKADSEQKDKDMFVSQHSRKPNVACSFSSHETKNSFEYVEQNLPLVISQFKSAYDAAGKTSSTMSKSSENNERNSV